MTPRDIAAVARVLAARVVDASADAHGAAVTTPNGRYRFGGLIGADGATTLVTRRFLAPFTRQQFSVAAGHFVPGRSFDEVVIRSVGNPPGHLWSFPRTDHLAVGMCAPADRVESAGSLRGTFELGLARRLLEWQLRGRVPPETGRRAM